MRSSAKSNNSGDNYEGSPYIMRFLDLQVLGLSSSL